MRTMLQLLLPHHKYRLTGRLEEISYFSLKIMNRVQSMLNKPSLGNVRGTLITLIERLSIECRKNITKVITKTNHNRRGQSKEPIRTRSKYK